MSEARGGTWTRGTVTALAILCNLLWAGAYVAGKTAIGGPDAPGFGPFKTACFRFGAAGLLLLLWGWWRDPHSLRLRRADLPAFGRLGLLGICFTYAFNYTGLKLSTGTAAALIMATEPVWIALLATVFLGERRTPERGAGIVLGLAGVFLVILSTQRPGENGGTTDGVLLGNLLIVASLLGESITILSVKRLVARYPGRVLVTYEFLIGALLLAPLALWETSRDPAPFAPSPAAWWAFAYLLVFCTLIAYTLWYRLLREADASELSVFIFLQPVIGTLIGVRWLGDPFTTTTGLGALLVLGGVACIIGRKGRNPARDNRVDGA